MAKKDKTPIPPSLQPRKTTKKAIPRPESKKKVQPAPIVEKEKKVAHIKEKAPIKQKKERFTLWLPEDIYLAFKVHVATRKGSASDYIEELIRKDLKN